MRYVVLGSSAAGINGAKELRRLNGDAEIILISKDKTPYSRCILHHYMSGARDLERISFVERDFEQLYNIRYMRGKECIGVDTDKKAVQLGGGDSVSYDKLLIATGASSFFPPIPGLKDTGNILGFRNLDDIELLKEKAQTCENIVVMGGGLVGVDAMSGFLHMGKSPSLVETESRLLSKQLDKRAAESYEEAFIKKGVRFYFNVGVKQVEADESGNIRLLELSDGTRIPCDLLVVTAGVRANTSFLAGSIIETDKWGLIIDAAGRTNVEDIFGAGDVTGRSPIWPVAVKEGIVAARNMAGAESEMSDFFASKSTMNFEKIPTMSLGISEPPDGTYTVEIVEDNSGYKKIIHKEGEINGAILQGDLSYGGILTQLIAQRVDVSKVKKPLFKIDYSDFFHIKDNFEFYYEGAAL